ncbi:MAG: thiol-disulfide oxidoreductase DCC family protein [Bacteroidia bacterium]|nr:thiol-disulfide oxidoreductase DCC family protein [Bacteroidia bacterium]
MIKVIIFDGVCNFCNASINFVMDRDPKGEFKFAANQSEAGQKILREAGEPTEEIGTVYLYENGKIYKESAAALRIARRLVFPWNLSYVFILIPAFIRDFFYRIIARNRYRWFGKRESCRLPSPEEAARFL